jgi:hypothetical protein
MEPWRVSIYPFLNFSYGTGTTPRVEDWDPDPHYLGKLDPVSDPDPH